MALSPEATALKEQAKLAADKTLDAILAQGLWRDLNYMDARLLIAASWLDGYKTGQLEHDRYVDEAHRYLLRLTS